MIAIAYVRRSKKSDDRTVSLDEQRHAVEDYAAKNNLTLAGEPIVDDGVSGRRRERFERIWQAVNDRKARAVIVYQLDRFARDVEGMLGALAQMSKQGVELHSTDRGKVDIQKANGRLFTTIEGAMHEHFRVFIGEKTRDALGLLRLRGQRYSAVPPFGYWFRQEGNIYKLEPDPQTAPILARVIELYCDGFGIRPTARAVGLPPSTVQKIYARLRAEEKKIAS